MGTQARKRSSGSRVLCTLAFVLAAIWVNSPGTAEARKIDLGRVQHVSHRVVKGLCEDDNTCKGFDVEPCERKAKRVARCKVHYFGEDNVGPYDCHWIFEWSIRKGSNVLHLSRRVFENTFRCRNGSGGHFRAAPSTGAPRPDVQGLKAP